MGELTGPSYFEMKQYIKDKVWIEFGTLNDKVFKGQINWYDTEAFNINLENGETMTLLRKAVIYYKKA